MRTIRDEDERRDESTVTIEDAKCTHATANACLCVISGRVEGIWVPQSVIHDDSEVYEKGGEGKLVVKRWWAEKNEVTP